MAVAEKKITIKSELGFPTEVYFDMMEYLERNGYTVKKTDDWLYINPKTAQHSEMMQRRGQVEQRLAQVMMNIGDLRRDIELLQHDLRKFKNALEHHREGDLEVLKSDFVDFVDKQNENSMLQLASAGRFPSIVIDFFKIEDESDIDDMDISESEKSFLRVKWRLFQQWRRSFAKAAEERVRVLRSEINSRRASLENYKKGIRPYVQAMHKIKTSEEHPQELITNPSLIEGFMTSVAGVELVAWRGVRLDTSRRYLDDDSYREYDYYVHFKIDVRRDQVTMRGQELEAMKVEFEADLKTAEEIDEEKKRIRRKEEAMMRELEEFRGEKELEPPEPEEEEEKRDSLLSRIISGGRDTVMKDRVGEQVKGELKGVVGDEADKFYSHIKSASGALSM